MDRIEPLLNKLNEPRADVRLRSAKNLLFKLNTAIVEPEVLNSASSVSTIAKALDGSISLLLADETAFHVEMSSSLDIYRTLLDIIQKVAGLSSVTYAVDAFSSILKKLFAITAISQLSSTLLKHTEEVCVGAYTFLLTIVRTPC